MTMPSRTDELLTRMLERRAAADPPDHLLGETLRRIAGTPQVRRGRAFQLRLPPGRTERLAVLAAVLVLLAGILVGGLLAGQLLDRHPAPSPTQPAVLVAPSASPLPSGVAGVEASPPAFGAPSSAPRRTPGPPGQALPEAWALPAGWAYDVECSDEDPSVCSLHLRDGSGREQDGWPVAIAGDCISDVAVGPEASAYVPCSRDGRSVVAGFDRTGRPLPGWPVSMPGDVAWGTWNAFGDGAGTSIAVGPDRTVYVGVRSSGNAARYSLHALAPDGSSRPGWPRSLPGGAQGFTLAPDGTVLAWWYEGVRESALLEARRTRFTMLGPDGRALPGWPIGSAGAASGPVVWRDGSIFYTSASGKVWGHDRSGRILKGWPYRLPEPVAPGLRSDGTLRFVVGDGAKTTQVIVLDRRGRMVPGWPYRTRSTLLAPACDTGDFAAYLFAVGPGDTTYLALRDRTGSSVVALDPGGRAVGGWPYRVPDGWLPAGLEAAYDGTISVMLSGDADCGAGMDGTSIRLDAAGRLLGDPPPTPLRLVYKALRPGRLRTSTGATSFRQGDAIGFRVDVVNRSSKPVILPHVDYDGSSWYAAGTMQTWIERLGPERRIDCLPGAGRKGAWYATGGEIDVSATPLTIRPGEAMPYESALYPEWTRCLPAGRYRYHVEYKPLDGDEDEVIAEARIDLTITTSAASPPPAPLATPAMTPIATAVPRPTATAVPRPTASPGPATSPGTPQPAAAAP